MEVAFCEARTRSQSIKRTDIGGQSKRINKTFLLIKTFQFIQAQKGTVPPLVQFPFFRKHFSHPFPLIHNLRTIIHKFGTIIHKLRIIVHKLWTSFVASIEPLQRHTKHDFNNRHKKTASTSRKQVCQRAKDKCTDGK